MAERGSNQSALFVWTDHALPVDMPAMKSIFFSAGLEYCFSSRED